jgi:hypothetical integral membrane protein (TIGR02206 family)
VNDKWYDYFWTSPPDAPPGLAFGQFTPAHFTALGLVALGVAAIIWAYQRASARGRRRWRGGLGIAVGVMEGFRQVSFIALGIYTPAILPLHACAVATFCVIADALRVNSWAREYLYAVGTWGPLAALLVTDWFAQPIFNIFTWQAFAIHGCLLAYPLMLLVSREFRPSWRQLWKAAIILVVAVAVSLLANHRWGTNFWFLATGAAGSPLQPILDIAGPAYIPVLVLLLGVLWTAMYLPWVRRQTAASRA